MHADFTSTSITASRDDLDLLRQRERQNTNVPPSESVAEGENVLQVQLSPRGDASRPVHRSLSNTTLERGASNAQWIPHAYNSSTMMGDGSVVARDPSRLVSRGGSSKEGRELNDSAVTC